jgi:hypothetical protein
MWTVVLSVKIIFAYVVLLINVTDRDKQLGTADSVEFLEAIDLSQVFLYHTIRQSI